MLLFAALRRISALRCLFISPVLSLHLSGGYEGLNAPLARLSGPFLASGLSSMKQPCAASSGTGVDVSLPFGGGGNECVRC